MPFTKEYNDRISSALNTNNLVEIDAVMMTQVIKPSKLSKIELCLKVACRYSQTEVIKKYLTERTFSEDFLYVVLFEAVQTANREIVQLLIEKFSLDQNRFFDTELCNANEIADFHISLDKEWQASAFLLSLASSDKDAGKNLLNYFLSIDSTQINKPFKYYNKKNYTVLLLVYLRADIIKLLLQKGANPYIKCDEQLNSEQRKEFIHLYPNGIKQYSFHDLITAEPDKNMARNSIKECYLEWLFINKYRELKLLSDATQILNRYSSENSSTVARNSQASTTALHVAASEGDLDGVKLLIAQGANYGIKNEDGLTPFELAHRNGHLKVSRFLFDIKLQNTIIKDISDNELIRFKDHNLGEGNSAWVYKGTYNNQSVAIKELKNSCTIARAQLEIKYIMAFESPYIVKAHGVCVQDKYFSFRDFFPSDIFAQERKKSKNA